MFRIKQTLISNPIIVGISVLTTVKCVTVVLINVVVSFVTKVSTDYLLTWNTDLSSVADVRRNCERKGAVIGTTAVYGGLNLRVGLNERKKSIFVPNLPKKACGNPLKGFSHIQRIG